MRRMPSASLVGRASEGIAMPSTKSRLAGTIVSEGFYKMSNGGDVKKAEYELFVDAKKYQTLSESLTGAEIKALAGITPTYQLYEEEEGDTPDKPISDAEAVNLRGRIKHFYAVPPATFGKLSDATRTASRAA